MPTAMRDSNRPSPAWSSVRRTFASVVVAATFVGACGNAAPSTSSAAPTGTPTPTVTPTPDPHLTDPVTADVVFRALQAADLPVTAYNAGARPDGEPVNLINGAYAGWPLVISEYSSAKALAKARKWKAGVKPKQGEPPIAIKGLNILVEWGPTTGAKPPKLDEAQRASLAALIAVIDPLLYPLKARTSVNVTMPTRTPIPTVSPSPASSPTPAPSASP